MRYKFVYSCKKPYFRIQRSLEKHFLPSAGCGNIFPEKSCRDAWRNGSGLSEGQVNMADEAKLCSPIHSTFEALILGLAVRHCHGEELGPFCSSADCRYCSFWWSHWFAEHIFSGVMVLLGFRKLWWVRLNSDHDLFMVQVWHWEMFWSFFSVQPLSWSSAVVV